MNEELRRMQEQFNRETALSPEELKQLGIDGEDDEDPELLELMKEGDKMFNPKAGAGMKDIDIDKMDLNDADLDDPDLLREIGELGGEDDKQEMEEAKKKLAKLDAEIGANLNQAKAYKNQKKTEEALKHLRIKKQLEAEKKKILDEFPQLAAIPKPSQPPAKQEATQEAKREVKKQQPTVAATSVPDIKDIATLDIDTLETEVHNVDKIEAVSVLDEEVKLMKAKAAKSSKEDAEFYGEKKEQLEFRRNMIVSGIESGITSQAAYLKSIQKELAYEKGLLDMLKRNKAKAEDIKRVEARIKLIEIEMQPPDEDEEPPHEEKKQVEEIKKTEKVEVKKEPSAKQEVKKEARKEVKQEVKKEAKVATEIRNQLVIEESEVDFTKVDQGQYEAVLERLKDYVAATEFFLNNSLEKDAERLAKKVRRLKMCLQIVKDGKRIDLLKIEPVLRPEIMFGKDLKARIAEFQVLIVKLQEQLANQKKAAKNYLEKSKKDKSIKVLAANEAKNMKETETLIEKVKANMKNQWQPMPQYKEAVTYSEVEITRKDIGTSDVLVEYAPNPELAGKSGYTMNYAISVKEDVKKGSFDPHKKGEFKLGFAKAIKHIDRGEATFSLTGKVLLFSKDYGKMSMKLDKFGTTGKVATEFVDSSGKLKLAIALLIQKPTKGREIRKVENKKIVVTHFYPSFNSSNPAPSIPQPQPTAPPTQAEEIKKPAAQAAPKSTGGKDPGLPAKLPDLPGGITEADVRDPDDPANLVCCSYLEKRIATLNETVKQLAAKGQAVPSAIKDKLMVMNRNKAIIETQIESGKLTPETYKGFLETQKKKDMILMMYLQPLNQNSKMMIIKQRIDCIEQELQSF